MIEADVVSTCDGHLVCRHDCELSLTTDIDAHPEFASRRRLKTIDGMIADGWFIEDFTLAEVLQLKARERFAFRNHDFDGRFRLVTLSSLLELRRESVTRRGVRPGVFIEIKHADYFRSIGLPMDIAVGRILESMGLTGAESGVFVECFEADVLKRCGRIKNPLIQLLDAPHLQPADNLDNVESRTYADMITASGLMEIAKYASAVGAWKGLIVPNTTLDGESAGHSGSPTSFVANAHAAGLAVHAWTFRSEPRFLATEYANDAVREYRHYRELNVDGLITDFPDIAVAALSR